MILKLTDEMEDVVATVANLVVRGFHFSAKQIQTMASDMWGFLTLSLQGNASFLLNNAPTLEGFDVGGESWGWCVLAHRYAATSSRSRSGILAWPILKGIEKPFD